MIPAIKAEFRKLLTVRSTYIITALMLAILVLFAFYIFGYKLGAGDLRLSSTLASSSLSAVGSIATISALIPVMLITHEYRHNTIMYTFTASNSRSKVLLSKIIVASVYGLIFAAVIAVLSPLLSLAGVHLAGHSLVPQTIDYFSIAWRALLIGWGYSMAGLVLGVLLRSQVSSIAALFLIPGVVEQILSLLLKTNSMKYLPFTALQSLQTITPSGTGVSGTTASAQAGVSNIHLAIVFLVYLVVAWIVGWILFLRRDAN